MVEVSIYWSQCENYAVKDWPPSSVVRRATSVNNIVIGHMRIIRSLELPDYFADQTHPGFDSDGPHFSTYMIIVY